MITRNSAHALHAGGAGEKGAGHSCDFLAKGEKRVL